MKKLNTVLVILLIVVFVVGCSTKKDAFLNRSFHNINTKYNVLYNGNLELQSGLQSLNESYKENYWDVLPIEPLKIDELALPGLQADPDISPGAFEKAEEKAVKAIQKHSMVIKGHEKNKQIDNAYLLLGKSRYYSQRFVPALEAFNFVIREYPEADLINETKVWQAKTHIRLENEEQAILNLKGLLLSKNLEDAVLEDTNTALAMAYSKMDSVSKVRYHLNKATQTSENPEQRARNLFILGQLYRNNNQLDSSDIVFQELIDFRKAPYRYKIHSQLEKAKNITDKTDKTELLATLKKLIKNSDNREYLDEIYYQTALVSKANDNLEDAEKYLEKSIQAKYAKAFQKELSYEALGNLNFDKAKFIDAGAYYDSVLQLSKDDNSKRIRRLKRKRKNLDEVIYYEQVASNTDSILKLVTMSAVEKETYFTTYIEQLKEAAEKEENKQINTGFGNAGGSSINQNQPKGKWYFYNIQTLGFGEQEFKKIWGNRPLEDNWRLSNKTVLNVNNNQPIAEANVVDTSKMFDVNYYLDRIPKETAAIDSIKLVRNEAYYQLGVIYKEQFKENKLAANRLEDLLTFNPIPKLEIPAKYHLYKIYEELNDSAKRDQFKNDILTNYKDSRYAQIIANPEAYLKSSATLSSAENTYKELFYSYKEERYNEVIEKAKTSIIQFNDSPLVPKFELLKAYAIGKRDGVAPFSEALEYIVLNYPKTEESAAAKELLETINKNK